MPIGITFKGAKLFEMEVVYSCSCRALQEIIDLPTHTTKASPRPELALPNPILIPVNITYYIINEKTLKIYIQKSGRYAE